MLIATSFCERRPRSERGVPGVDPKVASGRSCWPNVSRGEVTSKSVTPNGPGPAAAGICWPCT